MFELGYLRQEYGPNSSRIAQIGLPLSLLLVVISIVGNGFPPIRILGFDFWRIHVYLLGGLASVFWIISIGFDRLCRLRTQPWVYFTAFVGYASLSLLWASDRGETVPILFTVLTAFFVMSMVVLASDDVSDVEIHLKIFMLVSAVLLVVAVWEFTTGNHLPSARMHNPPANVFYRNDTAASATFYNRNDFAVLLAFLGPFLARGMIKEDSVMKFAWKLGIFVLALTTLIINSSRAGIIAFIGGFVMVVILWHCRNSLQLEKLPSGVSIWTGAVGLYASLMIILPVLLPGLVQKSWGYSLWARWQMVKTGAHMVVHNPLGVGLGNFSVVAETISISSGHISNPHNWVIELLGELGILGLGLFILAYGALLGRLFDQYRTSNDLLALAIFCSLLWFTVSGLGPATTIGRIRPVYVIFGIGLSHLTIQS